jgi:hypothetical protein
MSYNRQKKPDEKVRVTSSGCGSVGIDGLVGNEGTILAGAISGHYWVKGDDNGRLDHLDARKATPNPLDDDEMLPFWRPISIKDLSAVGQQEMVLDEDASLEHHMPSIIIQHLCGYGYTEEGYKKYAEILTGYGFNCLRSRRGEDGKFWEVWFLPGLWSAKGDLEKHLSLNKTQNNTEKLKCATDFIASRVLFGTLDVCVQRMAMGID